MTTGRPGEWSNAFGRFQYRHLHKGLFGNFRQEPLGEGQQAFVATPAKALADLVHLVPGADSREYLRGLRLDAVSIGDLDRDAARLAGRPKVRRAFEQLLGLGGAE
ncbi:MAG: hypothetical protein JRS35_28350 [Deltaproteobacteria bacterium]|nr:hypothetical protein [Deltaproteobacteria bacterium]